MVTLKFPVASLQFPVCSALRELGTTSFEHERRLSIETHRARSAASQSPESRRTNHRGVIGRQGKWRNEDGNPEARAASFGIGTEPAIRRHAAGDADASCAQPPGSFKRTIE